MLYIINLCCVYSLESPHRGDSNECTAYICKIKEEILPKLSVYRIWRKALRTQERIRFIHGKRAIGVRAIEVPLYYEQWGNFHFFLLLIQADPFQILQPLTLRRTQDNLSTLRRLRPPPLVQLRMNLRRSCQIFLAARTFKLTLVSTM